MANDAVDRIHPNPTGHAAAAAAVNLTTIVAQYSQLQCVEGSYAHPSEQYTRPF